MNPDEFFQAGKVVKTSGSGGELVFSFDSEVSDRNKKMESVFILLQGNLVPFFIEKSESKARNQLLVKLLDVDTQEEASLLAGSGIFLPKSMKSRKKQGKKFDIDFNGFLVIDKVHGEIGLVVNVLELPMQELLEIEKDGKLYLIPLVEEIITEINIDTGIIRIEAPEGLIELYQ
ncbi:MAG: 16S rRNA processing protein RimM [Bacteroidales bacterium]|nr:16S rRNA processing protein RimM [Bacteroidales bacterium]